MGSKTVEDGLLGQNVQRVRVDGLLFDMDGTIIDSTTAVVGHWRAIAEELGVDADTILKTSHGRRSIDVLRLVAPEKATWEYTKKWEALLPLRHGHEVLEIPGARTLLASLAPTTTPWAIVTSGTFPLVTGWLEALSLPRPPHLVTAEDVENGKPDPASYLLGKQRLGLEDAKEVLVFEDSPAGIRAGREAGCRVVGLVTTHEEIAVREAGAEWVVRDLNDVRVVREGVEWVVEIGGVL